MYVICSLNMPWDHLPYYIIKLQCQVTPVVSDGFCFLHAVSMILHMDHDEVVTLENMESSILDHMASNVNCYKLFHTGHVLKDIQRYFKCGMYCKNVLNLIVVATIYQKGLTGNIQILKHITHATVKEAHLKFTCDPSNVANNHYEAILLIDEPTQRHTEEEVTIESPCSRTFEQPRSWDDADDVIDLTDDSEMTFSEQLDSLHNNTSKNEL